MNSDKACRNISIIQNEGLILFSPKIKLLKSLTPRKYSVSVNIETQNVMKWKSSALLLHFIKCDHCVIRLAGEDSIECNFHSGDS